MRGYSKIKLKYIASVFNGNSIPDDKKDNYRNKAIPYIPTKELNLSDGEINYNNGLSVSESDGFRIAPKESVLLCIEGGSAGKKIGITDRPVAFVNKLCCVHGNKISSKLLYYCLKSKDFIDQFALSMTGMIGGVTVSDLKNIEVSVPENTGLQKKLTETISERSSIIDRYIKNEEQQIEKLKQYKQSLISEVVTKGLDPNAEMKDSGIDWIGMIPKNWEMTKVRYLGSLQNGISKGGEFFGEGSPFVSYSDVYKNYELPITVEGLIMSSKEERELYSVKEGDIFFTRTSETIEEVGFSSVCSKTIIDATFAGFLIRLRLFPENKNLILGFLKYYFRSSHIREYLVKEMNLVTRASLGQALLKGLTVLLPPTEEQIKIASYLDCKCKKIDKMIELKEAKISKLNEYKKSLIYEYVTGKKEVV